MSANFERLVDELEERLARSVWSVSRGPYRVTISTGSSVGAPGFTAWSAIQITAAYDPAAGVWVVTETQHVSTSDTADTSSERELGRFPSAATAIQLLDSRAL